MHRAGLSERGALVRVGMPCMASAEVGGLGRSPSGISDQDFLHGQVDNAETLTLCV